MNDPEALTSRNEWNAIFDALGIPKTVNYNRNPRTAPRYLVVCRGGNCRSVAVGFLLKYKYFADALSISLEKNGQSAWETLLDWADVVLTLQQEHFEEVTEYRPSFAHKVKLLDLHATERFRVNPYDLEFLREVDDLLQRIL